MSFYAGVDPGQTGAIAIVSKDCKTVYAWEYPGSYVALNIILKKQILNNYDIAFAIIEKQSPASGRSSSFSIGGNFNQWLMGLADISHKIITPSVWQKAVLGGVKKTDNIKAVSAEIAQRRFPQLELYGPRGGLKDGIADAVNIAVYARDLSVS